MKLNRFLVVSISLAVLGLISVAQCAEWRWAGKNAVVTGASSGIGAVIAMALAENGMNVVGLARREGKVKELASRVNGTIYPYRCDLSKEDDIIRAFQWVEKVLGGVDVLINNAGVYYQGGFINGTTKEWRNSLDVNVLAMALASREALKTMRKRGDSGHIVNINSVSGHTVHQHYLTAMYSPSKFAVSGFTDSLRVELNQFGSDIKITSISPGPVKSYPNAYHYDVSPNILPEDVAEAVIYALATRRGVQVHELIIQGARSTPCRSS